jgi:hypothetical protein
MKILIWIVVLIQSLSSKILSDGKRRKSRCCWNDGFGTVLLVEGWTATTTTTTTTITMRSRRSGPRGVPVVNSVYGVTPIITTFCGHYNSLLTTSFMMKKTQTSGDLPTTTTTINMIENQSSYDEQSTVDDNPAVRSIQEQDDDYDTEGSVVETNSLVQSTKATRKVRTTTSTKSKSKSKSKRIASNLRAETSVEKSLLEDGEDLVVQANEDGSAVSTTELTTDDNSNPVEGDSPTMGTSTGTAQATRSNKGVKSKSTRIPTNLSNLQYDIRELQQSKNVVGDSITEAEMMGNTPIELIDDTGWDNDSSITEWLELGRQLDLEETQQVRAQDRKQSVRTSLDVAKERLLEELSSLDDLPRGILFWTILPTLPLVRSHLTRVLQRS